jgi:hypothetical protein
MFGFIKDALGALASPLTGALDLVGDTLGLPKVVTNSIKAAVGVATGNVLMVADGVSGVMSELAKNPPAKTEYTPPRDPAQAGAGYAPPATSSHGTHGASAPGQSRGGILDPITLEYRDALRQLSANFDLLEATEKNAALLGKNGKIDKETLAKGANNPRLPQGLRDACRFFLNHPEYRDMLDTAGKGGRVDGTISTKDVQAALSKVNADIAKYGVRDTKPAPAPSTPAPAPTQGKPGSPLDSNFGQYREMLGILDANYRTFDASVGRLDEFLTRDNLKAIANNPNASAELKKVAQFFIAHPEYYDRLEMSAGFGGRDGVVGWGDVKAAIAHADSEIAKYGLPVAPGTGTTGGASANSGWGTGSTGATSSTSASSGTASTGSSGGSTASTSAGKTSGGSNIRDILNNPNLSIEEKLQAIMMALTESVDAEILQTMDDLAAAQDKRAGIENKEENKKAAADADRNVEFINLRLQKLMEKRKSMFDLMSNMSSKFNEMAKTAINNLRSA